MNGTIIMFPIKMQQAKPLNAVQRIKQKNDPDLMVKLVQEMQAKRSVGKRKGERV